MEFLTGKQKWRITDRGLMVGSLTVAGDRMIILGQRGELVFAKINPSKFDGLVREQAIGGRCWTMPVLSNDMLFLRNSRGDLLCFNLKA